MKVCYDFKESASEVKVPKRESNPFSLQQYLFKKKLKQEWMNNSRMFDTIQISANQLTSEVLFLLQAEI